jgi:hypothetical protein
MLMLPLICLLFGAVLGQRFKVLALIPAMALALTAAGGVAHAGTFPQVVAAAFVGVISLQIGYVTGLCIRYLMAVARTNPINAGSLAASTSPGVPQIEQI